MTTKQRISLMAELWPDACAATGWDEHDRDFRLATLSQIVGRQLHSSNDLDHLKDFDDVKSRLLALSQPANLEAQVRITNMQKTRLQFAIRKLDKRFIRGYDPTGLSAYTKKILHDRFGHADLDRLSLEQLTQLRNTLAARQTAQPRSADSLSARTAAPESDQPF